MGSRTFGGELIKGNLAGGVESQALGLPFESTPCEDWYGFGDGRCPSRYIETGDLRTDIKSLEKWIGYYSLRVSANDLKDKLRRKQAELKTLSTTEQQEQRSGYLIKMIAMHKREITEQEKTLAGFHPAHYIRDSIQSDINAIQIQIKKKMRN